MNDFKQKAQKVIDHLNSEFAKIRAGRPSTDLLSEIQVESYGSMMPINQVASITVADSNMIVISPWDKSLLEAISKAIQVSNLGVNPVVDSDSIRLVFPPLTEEKRKEFVKLCGQKAEEARVGVRQVRKDIMQSLDQKKKEGVLTEDQHKAEEKKLQLEVDSMNKSIDGILTEKEKKLMTL